MHKKKQLKYGRVYVFHLIQRMQSIMGVGFGVVAGGRGIWSIAYIIRKQRTDRKWSWDKTSRPTPGTYFLQ